MQNKNIRIEVWTDLYYARFIAIWRPEEEESYEIPDSGSDTRPEQERNLPYILVTSAVYEGRQTVVGDNPVATSQHPMPTEFLQQQIRHISYMFANEFSLCKPPSKAAADSFLAKQRLGYTKVKELDVTVTPAHGSMTLREFRDSLFKFTDEQLDTIKVMTVGENPKDSFAKDIEDYIHKADNTPTEQYITVTKLVDVYEMDKPYLNNHPLADVDVTGSMVPESMEHESVIEQVALIDDALADNEADAALMETAETMIDAEAIAMEDETLVTDVVTEPTKDEVQQQTIKDLQAQINALSGGANTPI